MDMKTPKPTVTVNTDWLESDEQRLSTEGEVPAHIRYSDDSSEEAQEDLPPNEMDYNQPSEASLELIRRWDWRGDQVRALIAYVKTHWWMGEYLFEATERKDDPIHGWVITVRMTTGGHAGNTAIITALQDNLLFWNTFWQASRREGYYELEVFPLTKV